jgi:hypothetical protein
MWSLWGIFIFQHIGERHFVFHNKSKTTKDNILPKLLAQIYLYLEQDKYTKQLV